MNRNRLSRYTGFSFIVIVILVLVQPVFAQDALHIYGYFSTNLEKVFSEPSVENGKIVKEDAPAEWALPSFNLMMRHDLTDKARVFINMSGADGETVEMKNFWGEYDIHPLLTLRFGKIYRKFGLYNEILDAVPTYYGIEPPELFDSDHLIVSRTTTAMLHGKADAGKGVLAYSVSTDNGEGGPAKDLIPLGWDVNYKVGYGKYTFGASGYFSGGETVSDVALGSGSPKTGVLPWMKSDEFSVFGVYSEVVLQNMTLQGAFWNASHNAVRDAASVLTILTEANPNAAQRARFLLNENGAVDLANIDTNGDYTVKTFYLRAGYSIETEKGELAPYAQIDYYKNDETIKSKKYGGDNEAGLADDGDFKKGTIGLIYRPIPYIAFKLDGSAHFQDLNGESNSYPEIRFNVSYLFGQ